MCGCGHSSPKSHLPEWKSTHFSWISGRVFHTAEQTLQRSTSLPLFFVCFFHWLCSHGRFKSLVPTTGLIIAASPPPALFEGTGVIIAGSALKNIGLNPIGHMRKAVISSLF
ncbi:hypothetical protein DIPPA_30434 [Diplonema papillatum]|nr:hypothetical protein DIPPA_30434 [Diplonema papillatum]